MKYVIREVNEDVVMLRLKYPETYALLMSTTSTLLLIIRKMFILRPPITMPMPCRPIQHMVRMGRE